MMKIDVKWIIFLLLVMSMGTFIYATAQIPDYLIYNNETFALTVNPLEPYLKKNDIRPGDYFPKKDKITSSTACWRGYVGVPRIIGLGVGSSFQAAQAEETESYVFLGGEPGVCRAQFDALDQAQRVGSQSTGHGFAEVRISLPLPRCRATRECRLA